MVPAIATKYLYIKPLIYQLFLFLFPTANMFRPLRAILRWDIHLVIISVFEGLF
jgi:hypothetical protein